MARIRAQRAHNGPQPAEPTQKTKTPPARDGSTHRAASRKTRPRTAGAAPTVSRVRVNKKAMGRTLADMAEGYLRSLEGAGKSRGTVLSYSMDLALALRHLGDDTQLGTLTEGAVAEFFACDAVTKTRTGKPKAEVSIAKTRRILRLALQWAADRGWIADAPLPSSR